MSATAICWDYPRNWPTTSSAPCSRCCCSCWRYSAYSLRAGSELHGRLLYYLAQVLPPAAYDIVTKTIEEVTKNTGSGKITLGILLALFSASAGINSMISGLNQIYQVRDHRPFWKVRLLAVGLTLGVSFLVTSALIIIVAGGWIATWVGGLLYLASTVIILWRVVQTILAVLSEAWHFR